MFFFYFSSFAEYIPEDVLLDIKDKLDDTLSHIFKKYNIEQHTKIMCKSIEKKWQDIHGKIFFYLNKIKYLDEINFISCYALTATNESLHTEIREVMHTMDKLRNKLYEDFRPQIKMLAELQINDGNTENVHPLVATKKVTQVRIPPATLSQDNQLEVLAIEPSNINTVVPKLPPTGSIVKSHPKVESIVYIMKNPVMPWIKGKVCIISTFFFIFYLSILLSDK